MAEMPKPSTAMDRWLRKRKNRKQGWQFKCIIADGEKKISNRIPWRFETFLVCLLIERLVPSPVGGGIARGQRKSMVLMLLGKRQQ